jgi:hypothetical protein
MVGIVLGLITWLLGKRILLTADIFVENRAVKDYNGFLKSVSYNANTIKLIRSIISDEEVHINNWKAARGSLDKR